MAQKHMYTTRDWIRYMQYPSINLLSYLSLPQSLATIPDTLVDSHPPPLPPPPLFSPPPPPSSHPPFAASGSRLYFHWC